VLDIGKGGRPAPNVIPVRTRLGFALRLVQFAAGGWVLHLHVTGDNPTSWLVIASVIGAGRVFGRPPLVTLHSGLVPRYLADSARRRVLARALLAQSCRSIVVSHEIAAALKSVGVPPALVEVLPAFLGSQLKPGQPPKDFGLVQASFQPLLALADHPSALYGRRVAFQALKMIARHFPRAGLALFGPGSRSQAVEAEALAAGVRARVHDFGELDHSTALGLMSRCDAFLRPTTADGDSVSVREALCLGTPCIASDAAIRPQGTVVFRSEDSKDLAKKVIRCLESPSARPRALDVGPALLEEYERAWARRRPRLFGRENIGRENLELGPR
jgi:glycosyltransferase involved in cell wall biosynthesis